MIDDKVAIVGNQILKYVVRDNLNITTSLLNSDFSLAFFFLDKHLETKDENSLKQVYEITSLALNHFVNADYKKFNLCDGITGILFMEYSYQNATGGLSLLDAKTLTFLEELAMNWAKGEIKKNNWDYLHGIFGVLHTFALKKSLLKKYEKDIREVVETFCLSRKVKNNISFWDTNLYPNSINLGFAHGVPGYLIILDQLNSYYSLSLVDDVISDCRSVLIDLFYENIALDYSFPSIYYFDQPDRNIKSRIAWCYGDLGILYLSDYFMRKDLPIFTKSEMSIMRNKIKSRVEIADHLSIDNCLCHGNMGNALMEHVIEFDQTDPQLSLPFWARKAIDSITDNAQFFNRHTMSWENDYSFLNGLTGVYHGLKCLNNQSKLPINHLLLLL